MGSTRTRSLTRTSIHSLSKYTLSQKGITSIATSLGSLTVLEESLPPKVTQKGAEDYPFHSQVTNNSQSMVVSDMEAVTAVWGLLETVGVLVEPV